MTHTENILKLLGEHESLTDSEISTGIGHEHRHTQILLGSLVRRTEIFKLTENERPAVYSLKPKPCLKAGRCPKCESEDLSFQKRIAGGTVKFKCLTCKAIFFHDTQQRPMEESENEILNRLITYHRKIAANSKVMAASKVAMDYHNEVLSELAQSVEAEHSRYADLIERLASHESNETKELGSDETNKRTGRPIGGCHPARGLPAGNQPGGERRLQSACA